MVRWKADKLLFSGEVCEDNNQHCSYWAGIGECSKSPIWMLPNCAKSCEQCGSGKKSQIFWGQKGQPVHLEPGGQSAFLVKVSLGS